MLSFRNLVFPGGGWLILMIEGLLRKVYGAVEQTMDVRVPDSDGCVSDMNTPLGVTIQTSR